MNTARIETLANRLFLSTPIFLVVASATFSPLFTQLQQVVLHGTIFMYIAGLVFLKTVRFEEHGTPALRPQLHIARWGLGFALSVAALFIGGVVHSLLEFTVLLQLLSL